MGAVASVVSAQQKVIEDGRRLAVLPASAGDPPGGVRGGPPTSPGNTACSFTVTQVAGMDNSSQWHVPFNSTKHFLLPIYSLVLGAGLPLNGLALWALLSQTSTSVLFTYMLNVVVANLLQLLTLPFWIDYSRQDHVWSWGSTTCRGVGLTFLTALYAKNGFLCLIAMERYLGLVHPLRFRGLQTARSAAGLCPREKRYAVFRTAAGVLSFFLPCFFMTFFYLRGLGKLKEVTTLNGKAKRKITRFIACMIIAFYLLQVPYQATSYSKFMAQLLLENSCSFEGYLFTYDRLALGLTTISDVADPLLYILLLKDVREALAKRLVCWGSTPAMGGGHQGPVPACTTV
ncbi:G-protein coupled receptor 4-like [Rhea pennata]|uniref:G-protein coupled receptor 4-like n=1 Tax=Rhea pennata TaxID=8795 RepID=UPI002E27448F